MSRLPCVRTENLSYRYRQSLEDALTSLDLEIEEGEFVLFAGPTGSGKSTLLRAIAGLVPHFFGGHLAGTVRVFGVDTRERGPAELSEAAGTVFQDPEAQVVMNGVNAELRLALEQRGLGPAAIARSCEEVALALGISGLKGRSTAELSGGELQRLALASVLVAGPRLLLLDEPTSQLDPVAADELFSLLGRLNREHGTTVLMSEHRLERCLPYSDRVIVLDKGVVACDAGPRAFLEWASAAAPALLTPLATMFKKAGIGPLPPDVKSARAALRKLPLDLTEQSADGLVSRDVRPSTDEPALELEGVWQRYGDGKGSGPTAIKGLTLKIDRGERVALVGANGAGKSTLLKVVKGLVAPQRGTVKVAGEMENYNGVALLMQNPNDYFLHERVRDELPEENTASLLERFGLGHLADQHPRDLSCGERQRLALAIVLSHHEAPPPLVALDEPTRGLDAKSKGELTELLCDISEKGPAVIVATHDVELAARLATRVVLLADGRVIADGAPAQVLCGGWFFATDVARALGSQCGAILPDEGARIVKDALERQPLAV